MLDLLQMTTEESELNVDVVENKRFTEENLKTLIDMRVLQAHPKVYGSKATKGIKYLTTELVNVVDVIDNNEYFDQEVRVGYNPEHPKIRDNIVHNGFSLVELPIFGYRTINNKFVILEGRTRFKILKELGMKNIIADVFDCSSNAAALRFALSMNTQKKPYGAASVADVRKVILKLVKMGEIDTDPETFKQTIEQEIDEITSNLTKGQKNQIVFDAQSVVDGVSPVISFPKGEGSQKWLVDNGYVNTKDTIYVTVSPWTEKVMMAAMRKERDTPSDVTEIRFVVQGGVLDSQNPEKDWLERCKNFEKTFESELNQMSKTFFGGVGVKTNRVRLYGVIPMVKSLKDKYPMDTLVYYKKK